MALRVFTAEFGMGSGVGPLAMATRPAISVPAKPAPGREQGAGIFVMRQRECLLRPRGVLPLHAGGVVAEAGSATALGKASAGFKRRSSD